jgi:hypothetical protein
MPSLAPAHLHRNDRLHRAARSRVAAFTMLPARVHPCLLRPCSTALPTRRGWPARYGCLHRYREPRLPPPSQRASRTELQQADERGELRMKPSCRAPCADVELHNNRPPFVQVTRWHCFEIPCCKRIFQVFQMFHLDITSVLSWCCKSRSGCCTCCNDCTRMFQVYVLNVLSVFPDVCLQVFRLDVEYVFVSVSDVCSNCFSCFRTYVTSVVIWMFQK